MRKQRNSFVASLASALEKLGYEMTAGEPGSVQRFVHKEDPIRWVALQDDDKAKVEDIVEHFRARGVDMDAFIAALDEVD